MIESRCESGSQFVFIINGLIFEPVMAPIDEGSRKTFT